MPISNKAEKLLRKISRVKTFPVEKTIKFNTDIIDSLLKYEYITGEISCVNLSNGSLDYSYFSITEAGRAYLDSVKSNKIRFWVPLTISAIALILSGLSIVLSPYFSAYFSRIYGL